MEEKILSTRKNGMIVLLGCILLELLALAGLIIGIQTSIPVMVAALVLMCIVWIPLAGLRVLKPEE